MVGVLCLKDLQDKKPSKALLNLRSIYIVVPVLLTVQVLYFSSGGENQAGNEGRIVLTGLFRPRQLLYSPRVGQDYFQNLILPP